MIQVAVLAISTVLCGAVIKRGAPELTMLLVLAAGGAILLLALSGVGEIFDTMRRLTEISGLDEDIIAPVVKTVAISILTKITGELCRSAGEGGIASFVDTAGTVLALLVALPLVEGVIQMMLEILA